MVLAGCTPLGAFNALVPKDEGARLVARDQAYASGDRRRLDVYASALIDQAARPVIVFFYGGSWKGGSKDGYSFVGRALAAQGFVVAVPDYRLVPQVRFPKFVEDSAAAVKWVRAHIARFGGDPDRIVLVGHSAGAYNAAMLAVDPKWLGPDRAAVKGWAALAGPYEFLPLDTEVTKAAFGEADDIAATQPILFASADDPPALLVAGGEDELVLPSQSTGMAIALVEAGAKAEALVYPDVGHVGLVTALAKPFRDTAPVLRDVDDFARRMTSLTAVEPPSSSAVPVASKHSARK
jgi:acetyl esterase/lipase